MNCSKDCTCSDCRVIHNTAKWISTVQDNKRTKLESKLDLSTSHITLAVPRILKSDGVDYTYYQSVCSCGWSGDYKASKLTAQEDKCPNR